MVAVLTVAVCVATAVVLRAQLGGGDSTVELERAAQFEEVLADRGVDCEFWEDLDVDAEFSESLYDLASFDGTVVDAGTCSLDEGDLVEEADYRYGDVPSSISTDVYVFDSADNAAHYASLMETNGCGGEGTSYVIVHARSWIAVLDFEGSQRLADVVASKFGAEGIRIAC